MTLTLVPRRPVPVMPRRRAAEATPPTRAIAGAALAHIETPLGRATLYAAPQGLAGLWFDGQAHHPGELASTTSPSDAALRHLQAATAQLDEYWRGARQRFDLEYAAGGTPFQQRVWDALRAIPYGALTSYGALASALGLPPGAARAVGAAIGRNPLSVIVPCHRVVGRHGALTGYAGGLERKRWLLELESPQGAVA